MGTYVCRKCGKKFESKTLTDGFCHECLAEFLDKYHLVREYLWEHPGSNASEISKACEVSVHQVMEWVREDRFMLTNDSKVFIYCEVCGVKITSGRLCERCSKVEAREQKSKDAVRRAKAKAEERQGVAVAKYDGDDGKMRFL